MARMSGLMSVLQSEDMQQEAIEVGMCFASLFCRSNRATDTTTAQEAMEKHHIEKV